MARRTKEEALATRERLLDTAEILFARNGVSHTPLNEIALAAGVTRGAIYWHFKDKAALFNAMMERVTLPAMESLEVEGEDAETDALMKLRACVIATFRKLVSDEQTQRVFEIATHKVEYVGELEALRSMRIEMRTGCLVDVEAALRLACKHGDVQLRTTVAAAALGLFSLVDGLIHNWILAPDQFDLVKVGRDVVGAYLSGLKQPQE